MKLAAIDIGSNAVRLQIVRTTEKNGTELFKKVEFVRLPVRLGDDAFKDGKISKEKAKVFYKAIKSFKHIMDIFEVDHYMACATSALREATNGKKIIEKVLEKTNLNINIISGKAESKIILRSIDTLFEENNNYLTIDVGGGSTEMTVIQNQKVIHSVSFDIGTVRMFDGAVKEKTWRTIEAWVKHNTMGIKNISAVVTSGTINRICNIISEGENNDYFTREQLKNFHRRVIKMSVEERIEQLKLNPDRADSIDASADIYLRILNWANINKVYAPSNSGHKDGILLMLYDKHVKQQ